MGLWGFSLRVCRFDNCLLTCKVYTLIFVCASVHINAENKACDLFSFHRRLRSRGKYLLCIFFPRPYFPKFSVLKETDGKFLWKNSKLCHMDASYIFCIDSMLQNFHFNGGKRNISHGFFFLLWKVCHKEYLSKPKENSATLLLLRLLNEKLS